MELMFQQQLYTGSCRLSGFATHTYSHIHCDMKSQAPNMSSLYVFVSVHVFIWVSDHHGLAHTQPRKTTVTQTSTSACLWPGESRGGLLIARQIARALFFLPRARCSHVAREIYYSGEREEPRRSRCRRAGCRRRSSREIYGCEPFTTAPAVCICVLERGSVRAI